MRRPVRLSPPSEGARVQTVWLAGGVAMAAAWGLAFSLVLANARPITSNRTQKPQFEYAGGTEDLPSACRGTLQLTSDSMIFTCPQHSIAIPYRALETMQYRADVTRRVRKMRLKWRLPPPMGGGHTNRYFTLVYRLSSAAHVVILQVPSDEMNPYLAEIDLKCGRRVDVQRHEDYE